MEPERLPTSSQTNRENFSGNVAVTGLNAFLNRLGGLISEVSGVTFNNSQRYVPLVENADSAPRLDREGIMQIVAEKIYQGEHKSALKLIHKYQIDLASVSDYKNPYGDTFFHQFIRYHVPVTLLKDLVPLLRKSADLSLINRRNANGLTPIQLAVSGGVPFEFLLRLQNAGASLTVIDPDGRSLAERCADYENTQAQAWVGDVIKLGLDSDDNVSRGWQKIHYAVQSGIADIVKKVVADGHAINTPATNGFLPIHLAAKLGNYAVFETVRQLEGDILAIDDTGRTVCHYAAMSGELDVIQKAMQHGVWTGEKDKWGRLAIHYAAEQGHYQAFTSLLTSKRFLFQKDNESKNSLHYAVLGGCIPIIELVLEESVEVDSADNQGRQAIHLAASQGHFTVFTLLLQYDAVAARVDAEGCNVLHYAAEQGRANFLSRLVNSDINVDVNSVDKAGNRPLKLALLGGHIKAVAVLLQHPATDWATNHPLLLAIQYQHTELAAGLIKYKPECLDRQDDLGLSPMLYARATGNPALITLVEANGGPELSMQEQLLLRAKRIFFGLEEKPGHLQRADKEEYAAVSVLSSMGFVGDAMLPMELIDYFIDLHIPLSAASLTRPFGRERVKRLKPLPVSAASQTQAKRRERVKDLLIDYKFLLQGQAEGECSFNPKICWIFTQSTLPGNGVGQVSRNSMELYHSLVLAVNSQMPTRYELDNAWRVAPHRLMRYGAVIEKLLLYAKAMMGEFPRHYSAVKELTLLLSASGYLKGLAGDPKEGIRLQTVALDAVAKVPPTEHKSVVAKLVVRKVRLLLQQKQYLAGLNLLQAHFPDLHKSTLPIFVLDCYLDTLLKVKKFELVLDKIKMELRLGWRRRYQHLFEQQYFEKNLVYKLAQVHYHQRQYATAQSTLDRVMAELPTIPSGLSVEAQLLQMQLFVRKGSPERVLDKVLETMALAEAYFGEQDYQTARIWIHCGKMVMHLPESPQKPSVLQHLQTRLRDFGLSERAFSDYFMAKAYEDGILADLPEKSCLRKSFHHYQVAAAQEDVSARLGLLRLLKRGGRAELKLSPTEQRNRHYRLLTEMAFEDQYYRAKYELAEFLRQDGELDKSNLSQPEHLEKLRHECYQFSAESGYVPAQFQLGINYLNPYSFSSQQAGADAKALGEKWLTIAKENQSYDAARALFLISQIERKTIEEPEWERLSPSEPAILFASRVGLIWLAEWLVRNHYRQNTLAGDVSDQAILRAAIQFGDSRIVRQFLELGLNPHQADSRGWTAMHYAAEAGRADLLHVLHKTPSDVNAVAGDGLRPIHLAIMHGHFRTFMSLRDKLQAKYSVVDINEKPILHHAVATGHIALVRDLVVSMGQDVNTMDANGVTPIQLTASLGDDLLYLALVKLQAKQSVIDQQGRSLLHYAAQGGSSRLILRAYHYFPEVNLLDNQERTPLHLAASRGHFVACETLLDLGADVSIVDKKGWGVLHHAAQGGDPEIIKHFVQRGCPIDSPTVRCQTPLAIAAAANQLMAYRTLRELGAAVTVQLADNQAVAPGPQPDVSQPNRPPDETLVLAGDENTNPILQGFLTEMAALESTIKARQEELAKTEKELASLDTEDEVVVRQLKAAVEHEKKEPQDTSQDKREFRLVYDGPPFERVRARHDRRGHFYSILKEKTIGKAVFLYRVPSGVPDDITIDIIQLRRQFYAESIAKLNVEQQDLKDTIAAKKERLIEIKHVIANAELDNQEEQVHARFPEHLSVEAAFRETLCDVLGNNTLHQIDTSWSFIAYDDLLNPSAQKSFPNWREIFRRRFSTFYQPVKALIVGGAGLGKSMLSQKIARQWWQTSSERTLFLNRYQWVFLLPIHELSHRLSPQFRRRSSHVKPSMGEVLTQLYFSGSVLTYWGKKGIEQSDYIEWFDSLIQQEPSTILWLVDGYDEDMISNELKPVLNTIQSYLQKTDSHYVLTCRPQSLQHLTWLKRTRVLGLHSPPRDQGYHHDVAVSSIDALGESENRFIEHIAFFTVFTAQEIMSALSIRTEHIYLAGQTLRINKATVAEYLSKFEGAGCIKETDPDVDPTAKINGMAFSPPFILPLLAGRYLAKSWLRGELLMSPFGLQSCIEFIVKHRDDLSYELVWQFLVRALVQMGEETGVKGQYAERFMKQLIPNSTPLTTYREARLLLQWLDRSFNVISDDYRKQSVLQLKQFFSDQVAKTTQAVAKCPAVNFESGPSVSLALRLFMSDLCHSTNLNLDVGLFDELVSLTKSSNSRIKLLAVSLLSQLSELSFQQQVALVDLLQDKEVKVRFAAAECLRHQEQLLNYIVFDKVRPLLKNSQHEAWVCSKAAEIFSFHSCKSIFNQKRTALYANRHNFISYFLSRNEYYIKAVYRESKSVVTRHYLEKILEALINKQPICLALSASLAYLVGLWNQCNREMLHLLQSDSVEIWVRGSMLEALSGKNLHASWRDENDLLSILTDDWLRSKFIKVLSRQANIESFFPVLLQSLSDRNRLVRYWAVRALHKYQDLSTEAQKKRLETEAQEKLLELAKKEDAGIRRYSFYVLSNIESKSQETAQWLAEVKRNTKLIWRELNTASFLVKDGAMPLEQGMPRFGSLSTHVFLPENVRQLLAGVTEQYNFDSWSRWYSKFMSLEDSLQYALNQQVALSLEDVDEWVRCRAIEAFEQQEELPDEFVLQLARLLADLNEKVRWKAAMVLEKQPRLSDVVYQQLAEGLYDHSYQVRIWAAKALGKNNELPENTQISLARLLLDESVEVRRCAVDVLNTQKSLFETIPLVIAGALHDIDDWVQSVGIAILKKCGRLEPRVQFQVIDLLESTKSSAWEALAEVLCQQEDIHPSIWPKLRELLHTRNLCFMAFAYQVLGKHNNLPWDVDKIFQTFFMSKAFEISNDDIKNITRFPELLLHRVLDWLKADNKPVSRYDYTLREKLSKFILQLELPLSALQILLDWMTPASSDQPVDFWLRKRSYVILSEQILPEAMLYKLFDLMIDTEKRFRNSDNWLRSYAYQILRKQYLPESILLGFFESMKDVNQTIRQEDKWYYSYVHQLLAKQALPRKMIDELFDIFSGSDASFQSDHTLRENAYLVLCEQILPEAIHHKLFDLMKIAYAPQNDVDAWLGERPYQLLCKQQLTDGVRIRLFNSLKNAEGMPRDTDLFLSQSVTLLTQQKAFPKSVIIGLLAMASGHPLSPEAAWQRDKAYLILTEGVLDLNLLMPNLKKPNGVLTEDKPLLNREALVKELLDSCNTPVEKPPVQGMGRAMLFRPASVKPSDNEGQDAERQTHLFEARLRP